jgi:hypothetical protein
VAGLKDPLGVKVEFETVSLGRLMLISDTIILNPLEEESTQNRKFLKTSN